MAGIFRFTWGGDYNVRASEEMTIVTTPDGQIGLDTYYGSRDAPTVGAYWVQVGTPEVLVQRKDLPGSAYYVFGPTSYPGGFVTEEDGLQLDWSAGTGAARFTGGEMNDWLVGGLAADRLDGAGGDDRILGGSGDTLLGGDGNDVITITGPAALIDGGAGTDTLIADGTINLAAGSVAGIERVVVEGGSSFNASALTDGLTIGVRSGAGSASTIVQGTQGNDRITSGSGGSVLYGMQGNDTLLGGSGADRFCYLAGDDRDTFVRFQSGTDLIAIDSSLATDFADLDITEQNGNRSIIDFGGGDLVIVRGVVGLTDSDFLFI